MEAVLEGDDISFFDDISALNAKFNDLGLDSDDKDDLEDEARHTDISTPSSNFTPGPASTSAPVPLETAFRTKSGKGHTDPGFDAFVCLRMDAMQSMLNFYTSPLSKTRGSWVESLLQAAVALGRGAYCSHQVHTMILDYIHDG
ncbi:hypothetical protein B0H19DRAFT_1258738 [Mycena capillaripes]|nr:hypothetical protein B0H19DRAFT_1258738 [Mycena capillaripes]